MKKHFWATWSSDSPKKNSDLGHSRRVNFPKEMIDQVFEDILEREGRPLEFGDLVPWQKTKVWPFGPLDTKNAGFNEDAQKRGLYMKMVV